MPLVLAFDTSGPYCAAALIHDGDVIATQVEHLARGQAERLMVMAQEVLAEAKLTYQDLTRIGVGIGPGNFTGIRISVAAARGLALSLNIPAIGVDAFEALAFGADLPVLTCLGAPRGEFYLQERHADRVFDPVQVSLADMPPPHHTRCVCVGHNSADLAAHLGLSNAPAAFAPASAIARIAAIAPASRAATRPSPYYLRAPDAAPSRIKAPVILG